MKTVILTGGTGFVGAFLSAELLRQGFGIVFLARGKGAFSASERVKEILSFVDPELKSAFDQTCTVLECDITGDNQVLSRDSIRFLKALKPTDLFHCAGSVDFSINRYELTMRTNVGGTETICNLAKTLGVSRFHHMSTLYVAGKKNGRIGEEDLWLQGPFNNAYEKSKAHAERVVQSFGTRTGISYTIYRLPIVIGHRWTGRTLSFTGFYGFFKPFWHTLETIRKKFRENKIMQNEGIHFQNDFIWAPFRILCNGTSAIDLVTVDWIASTIRQIASIESPENMTLHLGHEDPPLSMEVIKDSLTHLGLCGARFSDDANAVSSAQPGRLLSACQRKIDMIIAQFSPYANGNKQFSRYRLERLLGNELKSQAPLDSILLFRLLRYATHTEFTPPKFV